MKSRLHKFIIDLEKAFNCVHPHSVGGAVGIWGANGLSGLCVTKERAESSFSAQSCSHSQWKVDSAESAMMKMISFMSEATAFNQKNVEHFLQEWVCLNQRRSKSPLWEWQQDDERNEVTKFGHSNESVAPIGSSEERAKPQEKKIKFIGLSVIQLNHSQDVELKTQKMIQAALKK